MLELQKALRLMLELQEALRLMLELNEALRLMLELRLRRWHSETKSLLCQCLQQSAQVAASNVGMYLRGRACISCGLVHRNWLNTYG